MAYLFPKSWYILSAIAKILLQLASEFGLSKKKKKTTQDLISLYFLLPQNLGIKFCRLIINCFLLLNRSFSC
jgi:hypothetical protein